MSLRIRYILGETDTVITYHISYNSKIKNSTILTSCRKFTVKKSE